MSYGNNVDLIGNATRDPELKFTPQNLAVCTFGLAHNYRVGEDERVGFYDVVCFGDFAENVASSITKGMRLVVVGRLQHRSWETDDGDKRSKVEVIADELGPSLRWATADVQKTQGGGGDERLSDYDEIAGNQGGGGQRQARPQGGGQRAQGQRNSGQARNQGGGGQRGRRVENQPEDDGFDRSGGGFNYDDDQGGDYDEEPF